MRNAFFPLLFLCTITPAAFAHFVFVVPDTGENTAQVFLSETLKPDDQVDPGYVKNARLFLRDGTGREVPLALEKSVNDFVTALPGTGTRIIHGDDDLGITDRDADHPYDLIYYPKTILGDAFDPKAVVGAAAPVEIIPVGTTASFRLELVAGGKPVANTEITVLLPNGSRKIENTGGDGKTEALTQSGRYGAWARDFEKVSGERDGKPYTEVRRYATLVFDIKAAAAVTATMAPATRPAHLFARLPQAVASFGAVVSDGYLYVYGGHIAPTHVYSTAAVSGEFHRLNLASGKWETLPDGPAMQGLNLTTHEGKIYRIGGMSPRNKPGEPTNNYSDDTCAVFDPKTMQWSPLPPLPQPRSSHDVLVIGNTLIVVGGWTLKADDQDMRDTVLTLDLSSKDAKWRSHPQPFRRRALIAAAFHGKAYVMGGFNEDEEVVDRVDIFDPKTDQWSRGPSLPGKGFDAFGPAACVLGDDLYVSLGDGTLYRLEQDQWKPVGHATPRIVHRIAPFGKDILIMGGASNGKDLDSIERVTPRE